MLHFWQEPGGLVGRGFDFGQPRPYLIKKDDEERINREEELVVEKQKEIEVEERRYMREKDG